jgi:hypothetical protein
MSRKTRKKGGGTIFSRTRVPTSPMWNRLLGKNYLTRVSKTNYNNAKNPMRTTIKNTVIKPWIHHSNKPILQLYDKGCVTGSWLKPTGLWLAYGYSWFMYGPGHRDKLNNFNTIESNTTNSINNPYNYHDANSINNPYNSHDANSINYSISTNSLQWGGYIYRFYFKRNINVITIQTFDELNKFIDKYGVMQKINERRELWINWDDVCGKYDGIIFKNYNDILKKIYTYPEEIQNTKYIWYHTIDVDCACIFRPSKVISSFELIGQK